METDANIERDLDAFITQGNEQDLTASCNEEERYNEQQRTL